MIWIREDKEGILPIIYISVMGSIHGLFFTLYLILAFPCRKIYQWDDEDSVFALLAAFFPLATAPHPDSYARKITFFLFSQADCNLKKSKKCRASDS
jgi:hypothetical protein